MLLMAQSEVTGKNEPAPQIVKLARKWAETFRAFCESHEVEVTADAETLKSIPIDDKGNTFSGFLGFDEADAKVVQSVAKNGTAQLAKAFCREVGLPDGSWVPKNKALEGEAHFVNYNYTGRKGANKGQKVTSTFSGIHRVKPQEAQEPEGS